MGVCEFYRNVSIDEILFYDFYKVCEIYLLKHL